MLVDMGVRQAEGFQFLDQLAGQVELAGRAGVGAGVGVRGGVDFDIVEQTFVGAHSVCFLP